jgi:ABC-type phosphate transport system substrate-binding protein
MTLSALTKRLPIVAVLCFTALLSASALPAIKNMAVVVSVSSKLSDISLAELAKLCKGTQKTWPDGKAFTLVIRDPQSPEMRIPDEKLFGVGPAEMKGLIGKLNESRVLIKVVENDEDLLRTVGSTPGAAGIVDVYSINSSVKVLRVDGKLPFDMGYALKGN